MPEKYTLVVSTAEADTIGMGLMKLPMEQSMLLYANLKAQVLEQQKAANVNNPANNDASSSESGSIGA